MEHLAGQPPAWRLTDKLLEVREGETIEAEAALVELYQDGWKALGFQVTQALGGDPDAWQMSTDRWVGVAQLPERDGHAPQVRINPKMDADIFFLADYAFGTERNRIQQLRLKALIAAVRDDPAATLIAWFLTELEAFILRHLRRDYVLQREMFEGRVRGRLLTSEYFQRYVASGLSHRAPCQFFEFTQDNLPNQILKRSLRELRRLTTLLPLPRARTELGAWVDRLLPFLGAVADRQIHDADFNRLRLRASLRHYAPIMAKCRALLGRSYMTTSAGEHVQEAFLWNMPILFERALRGILRTTPGVTLRPRTGKATVVGPGQEPTVGKKTPVWPDFFLETSGSRLILDAKYKETGVLTDPGEVVEVEVPGVRPISIQRSDVYQAIAYGQHKDYEPSRIALVYPVVLATQQPLPAPYRVAGFMQDLVILFVDVGLDAPRNLHAFRDSLNDGGAPTEMESLAQTVEASA